MAEYSDFDDTPKNSVIPNIEDQHTTRVYNEQPPKVKYLTRVLAMLIQTPLDRWINEEVLMMT